MVTTENDGLMTYRDNAGNKSLLYPITKIGNVAGLDEALANKMPAVTGATAGNVPLLTAAGGLQDSGKQLTPAGIGAAPAGWGHIGMDLDNYFADDTLYTDAARSGMWWYVNRNSGTANMPEDVTWGYVLPLRLTDGIVKVLYADGTSGNICSTTYSNGVWSPWAHSAPTMAVGVEYRTTERWGGDPVYTCILSLGQKTDGKTVAIDAYNYIRYSATWGNNPLPLNDGSASFYFYLEVNGAGKYVKMHTAGIGESDAIVYLQLWFTK